MIDGITLITIIPPIVASLFTFIVAIRKSRTLHIKTISEIQSSAIEIVQRAEEQMRLELRKDIDALKTENISLKEKVQDLEDQKKDNDNLINTLRSEIATLKGAIDLYKILIESKSQ